MNRIRISYEFSAINKLMDLIFYSRLRYVPKSHSTGSSEQRPTLHLHCMLWANRVYAVSGGKCVRQQQGELTTLPDGSMVAMPQKSSTLTW